MECLQTVIEKFQKPLLAKKVFNEAESKMVFSNIADVLNVHVDFQRDIEAQLAKKTGRIISKPLIQYAPQMKCYAKFCCDLPRAMECIKNKSAKSAGAKALDEARANSGQRFALKDLLNVPMQRILKYPLLLKELIGSTADSHKDKPQLVRAKAAIDDVAAYINNQKKDFDYLADVMKDVTDLPSSPPLENVAPLLKDGDLMFKDCNSAKDHKKLTARYAFLFQKAILITEQRKTKFRCKKLVEFDKTYAVEDVKEVPKEDMNNKYAFVWSICEKATKKPLYTFAAKRRDVKYQWMESMKTSFNDLRDEGMAAPSVSARPGGSSRKPTPLPAPPKEKKPVRVDQTKPGTDSYLHWSPMGKPGAEKSKTSGKESGYVGEDRWYGGKLARGKAEALFDGCPDGCFLIRESDSRPGEYSLSVKFSNAIKHIKIDRRSNMYILAPDADPFPSIQELVEHFTTHSLNRHFPGMETCLEIPFKDALGDGKSLKAQASTGIGRARSRFAYVARSADELSFDRGVELTILCMQDVSLDPGWWRGALPDGNVSVIWPSRSRAPLSHL